MDAASGIGFPLAFSAGLISFLSPCVLPLVPGYLSAVAGGRPDEIRSSRVIGPALAFCGSFSFIFIALGLLGQRALRTELTGTTALKISGAVIIVMGAVFLLSSFVPALTGAAFALAWTPCTGPTLGAIITAAGTSASASRGAVLLAVYCAGLAVPFLFAGLAFGRATSAFAVVKRHYPVVICLGGAVLILMGILIWTGQFTQMNITVSHWLSDLGLPNLSSHT